VFKKKIAMVLVKNILERRSISRNTRWEDPSIFKERKNGNFYEEGKIAQVAKNQPYASSATRRVILLKIAPR